METKLSARAIPGQVYRVKRNPITKKYGVTTYRGAKGDDRAWPGELGAIVERKWTCQSGEENSGLWIEFSRGRESSVGCVDLADFILTVGV